ncbi:phosphoadenosine phosphosulfate reductase family protein [Streptomyces violaceusniger]|uniref:phosphoadenosine phosphosulfate reductase domain-containing protein n=1 Tax=Streptomyces violaceusniger TaxID=68280 RepID=UPI003811AA55
MTTNARLAKVYRKTARTVAEGGDLMEGMVSASNTLTTTIDALRGLADAADIPSPTPWRRLNAWAAFTGTWDVATTLHKLADRLDPVRLPVGYLTIHPARHNLIDLATKVVVTSSAGKDSVVMEDVVCTDAADLDQLDKVIVVHNDLGTTDSGEPVEWPGTQELAREQAARYGVRFEITKRDKGGLFQQLTKERKKFPSSSARWCTSDQKTSQGMKVVTRLVEEAREANGDEHVIIVYCVGLRAQESHSRAAKPEFSIDRSASNGRRTVIRWHPILRWSQRQVWQHIRDRNLAYHWAYDAGMDRLSCRLCVLATPSDLLCAARLSERLVEDYVAAEAEITHTFQQGLSIADIQAQAQKAGPIEKADIIPGAAIERHLADDQPEHPEQLTICAA